MPCASSQLLLLRGVKTQANELRSGQIVFDSAGRLLEVLRADHTQGQGRASGFVQLEARDLRSGTKRSERLRPSDVLDRAVLNRRTLTFLFADGGSVVLMDPDTFEQTPVPRALFGAAADFLSDGVPVTVAALDDGEVVSAVLPDTIEAVVVRPQTAGRRAERSKQQLSSSLSARGPASLCCVVLTRPRASPDARHSSPLSWLRQVSTGPSMKNERTDGRAMKDAVLESGATLSIPNFVVTGETVIVRPSDGTFVRRKLS